MSSPTYAPVAELDFTPGGDNLQEWMEKYNAEIANIYACINDVVQRSGIPIDTIIVDTELSKTSTNMVENRVVTNHFKNYYTKAEINHILWGI